jgi:RNA polymerase sigma factor (TIGR02999 family)
MLDSEGSNRIAQLMANFREGDHVAASHLIELLYPELRRLAAAKMKSERTAHTWQPTVLVNELYLTLVRTDALRDAGRSGQEEKAAFLRLAGHIMKHLLIDHARPLYRRAKKVEVHEAQIASDSDTESLQFVEETLARLGAIDARVRTVVEMRVFEGLTGEEIAQFLHCSPRTVASYWSFARNWLAKELSNNQQAAASGCCPPLDL